MRSKYAIGVIGVVLGLLLSTAVVVLAGNPVGPGTPPNTTSSYTLADIYESLNSGAAASPSTFKEPTVGPGTGTMHTLNEIYNLTRQRIPAPVARTGQTTSYAAGDDGNLQKGVAWPDPRFTDNGDGTVTDNLTGLVWLKNANCYGSLVWDTALVTAVTLNTGECGLTDGSAEGDWRLANLREMLSLIDFAQYNDSGTFDPALPVGHPFINARASAYWTSTTYAGDSVTAWGITMATGQADGASKSVAGYIWPVRDEQ